VSIVLASASRSRAEVLGAAGVPFDIAPADIDEDMIKRRLLGAKASVESIALALAEAKALAVSATRPDDIIVGGDQILWFEDELINKCNTLAEARALLLRLKSERHSLVGGLALAKGGKITWRHVSRAEVTMRQFSDAFLDGYLAREGKTALASVGVYRLEGEGVQLIESVEGSYFSVLGLDLLPLLAALRTEGALVQ
jgi:septum formation protein